MKNTQPLKNFPGFDQGEYVVLDCEKWLKDHRIQEQGKERGKQNQPNSQQNQPDEIFHKIKNFIHNRAQDCKKAVSQYINQELGNLYAIAVARSKRNPEIEIEHLIAKHCQDIETMASQSVNDLTKQSEEYRDATRDLNNFREKNALLRVAHYPENQVAHWMWVVAAGIAETFLSANLLGSVSRGGVIEGWIIAVMLTAVNILLGILAGRIILPFMHYGGGFKFFACSLGALCTAIALIWNDMAGHIRDVYVLAEQTGILETIDNAFATAYRTMIERPLPWASLSSAGLALIGVAVFVLTTYKAYKADDPFPGYGAKHRKLQELFDRYQNNSNHDQEKLKSARDTANRDIEEFKARDEVDRTSWETTLDNLRKVYDNYHSSLRQYNNDLSYLLVAYCDANRAVRTTPAPPFFDSKLTVDAELLKPPKLSIPKRPVWGDISTKSEEGFLRVEETYEQQLARFEQIREM